MRIPIESIRDYNSFKRTLAPNDRYVLDLIVFQSPGDEITGSALYEYYNKVLYKNYIYAILKKLALTGILVKNKRVYSLGPTLLNALNISQL